MQKQRGFTIAELSVVIVLISIISVAVTSFSYITSRRAAATQKSIASIEEVELTRSFLENWLDGVGGSSAELDATDPDELICDAESIRIANGRLDVNGSTELLYESVRSATFALQTNDEGSLLLLCRLSCLTGQGEESICIAVCPHVEVTP